MAAITKIVRRGTSTLYDLYFDDGTATTVYSATAPDTHGTLRAPLDLIDPNGAVLASFDDFGITDRVNLPLKLYDGAGTLVKAFSALSDLVPVRRAKVALLGSGGDLGGGVGVWVNPESVTIRIIGAGVQTTHVATGACTLDIGAEATDATTLSDNLIDGIDVHTALGFFDNITDAGTNGKPVQRLASGKWVTFSTASGAAAGLIGTAWIYYTLFD